MRPVVRLGAVPVADARARARDQRLRSVRPASLRVSVNTLSMAVPAAADAEVIASTRKWAPTSMPVGESRSTSTIGWMTRVEASR